CAARGDRTIVLSTDIAHSLADALDVDLGPEPSEIAPNLWAQEPDVYYNIGRYWRTIQNYVADLFAWHGLDEVLAEEMSVLTARGPSRTFTCSGTRAISSSPTVSCPRTQVVPSPVCGRSSSATCPSWSRSSAPCRFGRSRCSTGRWSVSSGCGRSAMPFSATA